MKNDMGATGEFKLEQRESNLEGLDTVLFQILARSPGIRLEHTMKEPVDEAEIWKGEPTRKILPIERWLSIVRDDMARAPTTEAFNVITGPHYFWGYDDLGRVVIVALHRGRNVPMFVEPWAGEPALGYVTRKS